MNCQNGVKHPGRHEAIRNELTGQKGDSIEQPEGAVWPGLGALSGPNRQKRAE